MSSSKPACYYNSTLSAAFTFLALSVLAYAAMITFETLIDKSTSGDGLCSPREGLHKANSPEIGTSGADRVFRTRTNTIAFTFNRTVAPRNNPPAIRDTSQVSLTIDGTRQTDATDGAYAYWVPHVRAGATPNLNRLPIAARRPLAVPPLDGPGLHIEGDHMRP